MKKIVIVCGEISGFSYAKMIMKYIKKINPSVEILGAGGKSLEKYGIRIIEEYPSSGFIGFTDVFLHIISFARFLKRAEKKIKLEKPDLIVFIDNPGFNLQLAKRLGDLKKIYYIPPKVWAHDYKRIKIIKKYFSSVITIFPFENAIYQKENIPSFYFGHPIVDLIESQNIKEDFWIKTGLNKTKRIIGLFPGSRKSEISNILPVLLKIAIEISRTLPDLQFIISSASEEMKNIISSIQKKFNTYFPVWEENSQSIVYVSSLCFCASGTMNLEVALIGKPMCVFYKMNFINYLILKFMIKLPYISPVNIIYGKKIVPEFLQNMPYKEIQKRCILLLDNKEEIEKQKNSFQEIKKICGTPIISEKISEFILKNV
ncbi:MAG: lipid-A-disaccharide synthase [Candidatus Omnitrophica bacterium]|jgi:lipid-A-disaccharide synthase|nr:lipid-A-disaccharide synthase [Candidatus Omnitrophota bacterium]